MYYMQYNYHYIQHVYIYLIDEKNIECHLRMYINIFSNTQDCKMMSIKLAKRLI